MENCTYCISRDRDQQLAPEVERRMKSLVLLAVAQMRSLEGRTSGDDSGLADPFEEYASQLYGEQGIYFEFYRDEALDLCSRIVSGLPRFEQIVLAAFADKFSDHWATIDDDDQKTAWFDRSLAEELLTEDLDNRLAQFAVDWWENRDGEDELPARDSIE